ncbi:hypothetical protein DFQ29_004420 [Apophysomyces sp. BC1021]|nr:hypothetical protein DFQ29_004420 [Apophysomyces sp. BC1021]
MGTSTKNLNTKKNSKKEKDSVFEVEAILKHRVRRTTKENITQYYIKWKDYGHEDNTWENEKNILAKSLLDNYWASKNSKKTPLLGNKRKAPQSGNKKKAAKTTKKTKDDTVISVAQPDEARDKQSQNSILDEVIYDSDYRNGRDWDWSTSIKTVELVTRYPRQDSDAVIYGVVRWSVAFT